MEEDIKRQSTNRDEEDVLYLAYGQSAEQGDSNSQYMLGAGYLGQKGRIEEGVKWLKKAAENVNIDACNFLGNIYSNGSFVEHDHIQSFNYYQLSANANNVQGQLVLAQYYCDGIGVPKDKEMARHWLKLALTTRPPLRTGLKLYPEQLEYARKFYVDLEREEVEQYDNDGNLGKAYQLLIVGDLDESYRLAMLYFKACTKSKEFDTFRQWNLLYDTIIRENFERQAEADGSCQIFNDPDFPFIKLFSAYTDFQKAKVFKETRTNIVLEKDAKKVDTWIDGKAYFITREIHTAVIWMETENKKIGFCADEGVHHQFEIIYKATLSYSIDMADIDCFIIETQENKGPARMSTLYAKSKKLGRVEVLVGLSEDDPFRPKAQELEALTGIKVIVEKEIPSDY